MNSSRIRSRNLPNAAPKQHVGQRSTDAPLRTREVVNARLDQHQFRATRLGRTLKGTATQDGGTGDVVTTDAGRANHSRGWGAKTQIRPGMGPGRAQAFVTSRKAPAY